MAVTMEQVRAVLDPEEPDYDATAQLGPGALPHLEELVRSGDRMLASKAAYAASLIGDDDSENVVKAAAQSEDPVVRVAAAAATTNLSAALSSDVLVGLVEDPDAGVRKVALQSVPDEPSAQLSRTLDALPAEPAGDPPLSETMPGEGATDMPAEHGKMPGE